jgi:hypothetical protein
MILIVLSDNAIAKRLFLASTAYIEESVGS